MVLFWSVLFVGDRCYSSNYSETKLCSKPSKHRHSDPEHACGFQITSHFQLTNINYIKIEFTDRGFDHFFRFRIVPTDKHRYPFVPINRVQHIGSSGCIECLHNLRPRCPRSDLFRGASRMANDQPLLQLVDAKKDGICRVDDNLLIP